MVQQSEVEETIRRLSSKKNVVGVVVVNQLGLMIRSTLEASLGKQYATLMSQLVRMAKDSVTQLDAQVRCLLYSRLVGPPLWPLTVWKKLRWDGCFL
jgi:predicted regulator of Ras-like GTPase activity (Roadblock/LC7/MglB family)